MKQGYKNGFYAFVAAIAFVASGCTEERPYDSVDQDRTALEKPQSKKLIDTDAVYLYLASDINSSKHTDATFPMYMGDAKIVKLQLTESGLNVVEIEQDERFDDNVTNALPVISLPITHVDFRCAQDADGKCTNQEEEDLSKPWAQRRYFQVKSANVTSQSVEAKPMEIDALFYDCYKEVGVNLTSLQVEKDAINISVDKTYVSKLECASSIENLSDLTFRVVNHYSLVKMNTLVSPDYQPLSYTRAEETMFGFFDTRTLKLDRDNNSTVNGEKNFVNRWNAKKGPIVYHLTENFNKPEYAKIKTATIAAVESINKSLVKAGTDLRIELRDAFPGMNPGDLRVNSIAMIEDPVNYGILGYGPTAANPLTGEIVHGRTAMYLGVMKTGIQRAYEEVLREKLSAVATADAETESRTTTDGNGEIVVIGDNKGPMELAPELGKYSGKKPSISAAYYADIKRAIKSGQLPAEIGTHDHSHSHPMAHSAPKNKPIIKPISEGALKKHAARRDERRLTIQDAVHLKEDNSIREQILSTHCFFSLDDLNIADSIEEEIEKVIEEVGAKPWLMLTAEEKDKVIDALLPFVWVPTLIHEIGHNLGLRHNFAGSEDAVNFYSAQELAEMGIKRKFEYSSVMDYGYKSTNELQLMGKYDIAALRFGYAENLELADGNLISLEDFRNQINGEAIALKEYQYCTDEHVAVNPNCNRFDEGTSLVEIAQHFVSMHEDSYFRRNFRNGARSFSLYDDPTQMRRSRLIIDSMRVIFERYDDIKMTFSLADNAKEWEQYEFLKDLKQATLIAGRFLIRLIETPDTLCAVAQASNQNRIIGVLPLRLFSHNAISCFDTENVRINPAYLIVGEGGKSFQSRKDPSSNNPYIDQIDVRGIWLDKLLAVNALVGRLTGIESFDEFTNNFLDIADMRVELQTALGALLLDETVTQVPIYTVTGQVLVAELAVKLYDATEALNAHKIPKPLHPYVQRYFGIPQMGVDFQVKLIEILQKSLPSQEQDGDETSLLNSIVVNAGLPVGSLPEDFLQVDIGLRRYFINQRSDIAALHAVYRDINTIFTRLGKEKLGEILKNIEAGNPPPTQATEEERLAYALGAEVIEKFLSDGFQANVFYENMIRAMAL